MFSSIGFVKLGWSFMCHAGTVVGGGSRKVKEVSKIIRTNCGLYFLRIALNMIIWEETPSCNFFFLRTLKAVQCNIEV